MKKTFKEILEIDSLVGTLYQTNPKLKDTKFGYACKRFCEKNFTPTFEERSQLIVTARINNALEDPQTKALLVDPTSQRGFKYGKEGLIKCIEEEHKIVEEFDKKEIEIKPFISSVIPEGLTQDEKDLLTGAVI